MFNTAKITEPLKEYAEAITTALYTVAAVALMILLALVTR